MVGFETVLSLCWRSSLLWGSCPWHDRARGTATAAIRAATRQLTPLFPRKRKRLEIFPDRARCSTLRASSTLASFLLVRSRWTFALATNSPFERNGQIAKCFARQTRLGEDRSAIKLMVAGNFVRTISGTTAPCSPSPTSPLYEDHKARAWSPVSLKRKLSFVWFTIE